MSTVSVPTSPETPRSAVSSLILGHVAAPPHEEVTKATQILSKMKDALDPLNAIFESLEKQVGHIAMLGGDFEINEKLNSLRKQKQGQDRKHKEGIEEIQLLLKDVLEKQMVEYLKQEIEKEYAEHIDKLVEEQVAACLKTYIPQELQDEVAESKRQLAEIQRALHNSESRHANASLQLSDQNSFLHTIYTPKGEISADYPKTLAALIALDGETSKRLMTEYLIPNVSDDRERNLNRFMHFCGVPYQMVWTLM